MGLAYDSHEVFSNFALVVRSSGICPRLSPEDEEVKRKLAKCRLWVYSELIRSDIPEPSGVSPSRALASRPSMPFVMKTSREGPSVMKPTREELQARVESLEKKKRSVKRKAQAPLQSSLAIRGKVLRLGAPSPLSTAKGWGSSDQVPARGRALPSVAEVSKVAGPKTSLGRSTELPLVVLPISIRRGTRLQASSYDAEGREKGLLWNRRGGGFAIFQFEACR